MSGIRRRVHTRRSRSVWVVAAAALLAPFLPIAAADAATVDVAATITASGPIPVGGSATSTVAVANVGADPTTAATDVTVLLPPNASATAAAGTGWSCTLTSARRVDCTSSDNVGGGGSFPAISVSVTGSGAPMAGVQYAIARNADDTNTANDLGRNVVQVVQPPSAADEMFLQLSGALTLRTGGNVDSGNLTISRNWFGLSSVTGTATIGSTSATFDVRRQWFPTPWTGTITITDPSLQGGAPLAVNVRAGVADGSANRQVWGDTGKIVIPSLDVGGITGALLNGVQIDLNWGVGDYSPTAPPLSAPPLLYRPPESGLWLDLTAPQRIQTGQTGAISANVRGEVGVTDGPINLVTNAPAALTPGTGGANTSCEIAGTWQVCLLNSSVGTPLGLGRSIGGDLRFTPTVPTSIVPLTVFADTPNDLIPTNGNTTTTNVDVRSPGPDLTITAEGPDRIPLVGTPPLWFQQGSNSSNTYAVTVTNVGSATSGTVSVVLQLGAGLTYNSVSGSGWSCSVTTPPSEVTCTRSGLGTSILNRSSTATVRVDVDPAASPTTTTAFSVSSPGDVAPSVPEKSASLTTPALPPNPTTVAYTFSNGAATLNAPAFGGGYTVTNDFSAKPAKIYGCASSRRFVPLDVLNLSPARIDDVRLCVNLTRLIFTSLWWGTVTVNDVRGPIQLPPPVPPEVPALGGAAPTATTALVFLRPLDQTGPATFGGTVSATNAEYVLSGGARFTITWSFTLP